MVKKLRLRTVTVSRPWLSILYFSTFRVANCNVSQVGLTITERSDAVGRNDRALFFKTHSPLSTEDVESLSRGKLTGEKPLEAMVNKIDKIARPVPSEVYKHGCRSSFKVLNSNWEDADISSLSSRRQVRPMEKEDVLSQYAGDQEIHINTLLKLCAEKKKLL